MNVEDLIREEEGCVLTVYKDKFGKATVGVGHLVRPEDDLLLGDEIPPEAADEFFQHDLATARAALVLGVPGYEQLDEVRQAVLISMCFNLGWRGLSGFRNTLALISNHRYADAAVEMLDSQWARQVPNRAGELSKMMRLGLWPKGNTR